MNQTDKRLSKPFLGEAAAEPVYALSSNSGCDMVFLDPSDKAMMQTVFWKVKDRQKLEAYYTNFDNYNFKLTESKTNERKTISSKEAKQYARLQQIRKDAQNVKNNIPFMEKAKIISHMSNLIS